MTNADQLFDRLLEDPEVREGYDEQAAVVRAGKLVREMREGAQLSQSQLAEQLGTSQAHLSMIERGVGRYGPTVMLLDKIARTCRLRLDITAKASTKASRVAAPPGSQSFGGFTESTIEMSEPREEPIAAGMAPYAVEEVGIRRGDDQAGSGRSISVRSAGATRATRKKAPAGH